MNLFADMLIPILQVIWIREGQLQVMSLLLQVELLAGCQNYKTLLLYPLLKQNTLLLCMLAKRRFGRLQDNIRLLCDSQSAIHLAKNPAYHSKSKHIPIKYHFVRQVITERGVSLEKVHTKENCADMFTKPVLLEKLRWCLASLGLQKR